MLAVVCSPDLTSTTMQLLLRTAHTCARRQLPWWRTLTGWPIEKASVQGIAALQSRCIFTSSPEQAQLLLRPLG